MVAANTVLAHEERNQGDTDDNKSTRFRFGTGMCVSQVNGSEMPPSTGSHSVTRLRSKVNNASPFACSVDSCYLTSTWRCARFGSPDPGTNILESTCDPSL